MKKRFLEKEALFKDFRPLEAVLTFSFFQNF
jgi:hypothetical protein